MEGYGRMNLVEHPDRDAMMADVAGRLADGLDNALVDGRRATLAVPGGTTPGPIFDALSGANLRWDRVDVMLTDERCVPPNHPRSNERLLRERLLVGRAAEAGYVPVMSAGADGAEFAERARFPDQALPVSVLLLGMGADMHTASLFPGSPQLADALDDDAPALMAVDAPGQPERRITMTAPALKGAKSIHIVISGAEKRAALERARASNDPMSAPICAVLPKAWVHWAE